MNLEAQVLGVAGMYQAVRLALDLAREGRCEAKAAVVCGESVLRIDAESATAVFGGASGLQAGLRTLVVEFERPRDLVLTRTVATVVHLERKLHRRADLLSQLQAGIVAIQPDAAALGVDHDAVVARLADLYLATISTLRPRIIVAGNGVHLAQPATVARIRVMLLAAIRAAVLWRQGGGTGLRLLLQRRQIAEAARALLEQL